MKLVIFRLRSRLANLLMKLAYKLRPRAEIELMQAMEDQLIFGTGFIRVDPKAIWKD